MKVVDLVGIPKINSFGILFPRKSKLNQQLYVFFPFDFSFNIMLDF